MEQIRKRKLNRLKYFDYSNEGYYYITICTKNRDDFFGKIENEKMILNDYGNIANKIWNEIRNHFPNCLIDEYIIMPNHIHGILIIDHTVGNANLRSQQNNDNVGNNDRCSLQNNDNIGNNDRCSLPTNNNKKNRNMELIPKIISQFKSSTTREIRKKYDDLNFGWQKSYYDHLIRNDKSLFNIRQYIILNPLNWDEDENNLSNTKK
jgi:putative transposase